MITFYNSLLHLLYSVENKITEVSVIKSEKVIEELNAFWFIKRKGESSESSNCS